MIKLHRIFVAALALAAFSQTATGTTPLPIPDWKPRPPERTIWRPPVLVMPSRDVSPIQLQTMRVTGEANGRQAVTEIDMTFYNPNGRVLEGELQFPLLDGQSVASFAMDVNGKMRDAVPVGKARGQAVFEDVIRGRIDPGLIEVTQGDNFKLRVYPIPARGTKRVLIRLNETLGAADGKNIYRLPVGFGAGPNQRVEQLTLDVRVSGTESAPEIRRNAFGAVEFSRESLRNAYRLRESRNDFAGDGLIEIAFAESKAPVVQSEVFQGKTHFAADIALPSRTAPREVPKLVGLVWDSSASARMRDRAREMQLLDTYFKKMRDGEVRLTEIRDVAETPKTFRIVNGEWKALRDALEQTAYDGATNLSAFVPEASVREYLLFSDGLSNFGNINDKPFAETRVPLYTINSSIKADATFLKHIAQKSGARFIDLTREANVNAVNALLNTATRIVDIEADGVSNVVRSTTVLDGGRVQIAGIINDLPATLRVTVQHPDGKRDRIEVPINANGPREISNAASIWATMRIAELDPEYQLNRAEIRRLGQRFRLVTRETSLIILDRIEDYARFEIEPPSELRAEYDRIVTSISQQRFGERKNHLENIVRSFQEKVRWWQHDFPKNSVYESKKVRDKDTEMGFLAEGVTTSQNLSARQDAAARSQAPNKVAPAMAPAPMAAEPAIQQATEARREKSADGSRNFSTSSSTIRLQKWQPNAPYVQRLRDAANAELYRVYLDEAPSYANSTAFFLDAADIFFERGMNDLGVRVLSNLAEMDLENRHILRILGYRLMQAKRASLAIPTLKRVLQLSPEEPQSYRDLGLAYAADKQPQKAVDSLYEVVVRPWHNRFPGVELIALAELNSIAANERVDTNRFDARLIKNLPLDLRAVLTWDADSTDIDLWVTDPNGEKAYYSNPMTYQGGRMSADFTGGYGPEEFSLKHAKPGKYKVEAQYFGDRRQNVTGATTLQVRVTTGFGTSRQRDQMITLRLKEGKETVYVGEITVGG